MVSDATHHDAKKHRAGKKSVPRDALAAARFHHIVHAKNERGIHPNRDRSHYRNHDNEIGKPKKVKSEWNTIRSDPRPKTRHAEIKLKHHLKRFLERDKRRKHRKEPHDSTQHNHFFINGAEKPLERFAACERAGDADDRKRKEKKNEGGKKRSCDHGDFYSAFIIAEKRNDIGNQNSSPQRKEQNPIWNKKIAGGPSLKFRYIRERE